MEITLPFSNPTDDYTYSHLDDHIRVDTPEQIALEFPLAGIGSRFLALTIDTLLQIVLYIAGIFAMAGIGKYANYLASLAPWIGWLPVSWIPALLIIFFFCVYWGYFAFFEIIWKGQTPGKRLAGIRVIKDSGRAVNVYEIIGRNLLRGIDFLPGMYVVGLVSMLISQQNQRLGDHLAGSIVVHDKRADALRPDWSSTSKMASADPQLSTVTPEEVVLIETYLQRRMTLEFAVRDATANRIAARIIQKSGIQRSPEQSLDDFLENIARKVRDSARFR